MDTLYRLAFAFKKKKLWKKMFDSELFAVVLSDGETGYCSVMGRNGEHLALAMYVGETGLRSCMNIWEEPTDGLHALETMLSQDCVMCSFENKDALRDSEIDAVRAYCAANGISLRGPRPWPQLERCRPYYVPWMIREEQDERRLAEALEAGLEVASRLEHANKAELGFAEGPPFDREIPLLVREAEGYEWKTTTLPPYQPPVYPEAGRLFDLPLKRASMTQKHARAWACDVFLMPGPVSNEATDDAPIKEPYHAPHFPWIQFVFDLDQGEILDITLCQEDEDYVDVFPNRMLELIVKHGKPRKLVVETERSEALYRPFSKTLGVQLEVTDCCEDMEEAVEEMLAGTMMDTLQGEMLETLGGLLKDGGDLSDVPQDMIEELMNSLAEDQSLGPWEIQPPHPKCKPRRRSHRKWEP